MGEGDYSLMPAKQVRAVRAYMRRVACAHVYFGEVNATALAEDAAFEFGLEKLLDCEANLFDLAAEEAAYYEAKGVVMESFKVLCVDFRPVVVEPT